MVNKELIWQLIEPLVTGCNVELFDIEAPSGAHGELRVYISKANKQQVTIDDCAVVARAIRERDEAGGFLPGDYALEVSSPGINRKLTRPEHFRGAIGERVRATVRVGEERKKQSFTGTLVAFTGDALEFQVEAEEAPRRVLMQDLQNARVDFLFTEV